jgi:small subunit ribosomal protein S1
LDVFWLFPINLAKFRNIERSFHVTEELEQTEQVNSIHDLKPKMRLQGTVKETQLYGALVDIGVKYNGLVHISQLSTERINRVTDVVQIGDNVTVWVTKVNPEKGRIGLTMVEPPKVDWSELAQEQVCTGTVTRIEPYGAFVDIGAERPGLLHVREMSSGYVRHPSEIVALGEQVEVRILKLDRRKRRIDLSMMGIKNDTVNEAEEEEEQDPAQTAMEIALQRAQNPHKQGQEKRPETRRPDLSEREDILARTLELHSKQ